MKQIDCRGTPFEIGFAHGSSASDEIKRGIAFYADLFQKNSKRDWPQVRDTARDFEIEIKQRYPRYYEEMEGIAAGARRDTIDIVAINVRTEIAFGLFSDGCTSLFWKTTGPVFLGQNWDWMEAQKQNLVHLSIYQPALPTIKMITEAGLIGKIGLNSAGVGVCLNAIKAKGLNMSGLPAHLALRVVLESNTAKEALQRLKEVGMASSAHILIGDGSGDAVGYEFTPSTSATLSIDERGRIIHSNHLILDHEGAIAPLWLEDSPTRLERMKTLTDDIKTPSWAQFSHLFEDTEGFPTSICRAQTGASHSATLFNIVMDLKAKRAVVRSGSPSNVEEVIEIDFDPREDEGR